MLDIQIQTLLRAAKDDHDIAYAAVVYLLDSTTRGQLTYGESRSTVDWEKFTAATGLAYGS